MPGHRGKLALQLKQLRKERNEASKKKEKGEKAEKLAEERDAQLSFPGEDLEAMLNARIAELEGKEKELEAKGEGSRKMEAGLPLVHKSPGGPLAKGVIKWQPKVDAVGEEPVFSPYTNIGGVPFRLGAKSLTHEGEKHLAVFLCCNDNGLDKTFSAEVSSTLFLAHRDVPCLYLWKLRSPEYWALRRDRREVSDKVFSPFRLQSGNFGTEWEDATDTVEGDCFCIEAEITLVCYYKNAFFDFSSPDPLLTDMILLVGGKEYHVNSKYLGHFSEVFKMMSLHAVQGGDPVPLTNCDADEFEEMLRMLYPQKWPTQVTDENVRSLLCLADRFDVSYVRSACNGHLMRGCRLPDEAKLVLAEQYHLSELFEVVRNWNSSTAGTFAMRGKRWPEDCPPNNENDFSSVDPLLFDVTLIAGRTEFPANKMFLAVVSGYFKSLFASDSSLDRVKLPPEVCAWDFAEFGWLLFPQREILTIFKVKNQLRLADLFDAPIARWRCIDWLNRVEKSPR